MSYTQGLFENLTLQNKIIQLHSTQCISLKEKADECVSDRMCKLNVVPKLLGLFYGILSSLYANIQ